MLLVLRREKSKMMFSSSSITARIVTLLIFYGIPVYCFALPSAKYRSTNTEAVTAKNGIQPEPTCEELKAMWRFSKRQSRAAELTNELPMYRDPFADNVWEPYYATTRTIGGMRMRTRPIFGKVIHNPPGFMRIQNPVERQKAFKEITRLYGMPNPQTPETRRRVTTFRLPGGGHLPQIVPQQGSFNHLKELIKTERARELQQQRMAEESVARASAMKDLERNQPGSYKTDHYSYDIGEPQEIMYSNEDEIEDDMEPEDDSNSRRNGGIISFPDLLAPAARSERQVARFVSDYIPYSRGVVARARSHRPPVYDISPFNNAYNGFVL